MEEIANIIYEYSINGKKADKEFVTKIVNILKEMYGLDDYIKNLNVSKKLSDGSDYNMLDNSMTINIKCSRLLLVELIPLLVRNKKLFTNLDVALNIFHEVDYALLMKLKELGKDTIDVELLNTIDLNESYESNDVSPFERRANINSHIHLSRIIDILYDTDLSYSDLDKIRFYNLIDFIKECRMGYKRMREITNSPSYDYMRKIGKDYNLEKIEIYDYNPFRAYNNVKLYKLKDRVLYGLPLESSELKEINIKSNPFKIYEKKIKRNI